MTLLAPPAASATLRLQTLTSFDDAVAVAPEWDRLVADLDGSLYMTFTWCQVWWRHYGTNRELRLMLVRDDDELVGVLPFFIERLPRRFGRARVAKVLASDSTPTLINPPVYAEAAPEAYAAALKQLLVQDGAHMVHVGPCSAAIEQLDAIRGAATEFAETAQLIRDQESGSHTVFEMPAGYDAYLRSLSKNQRSNYRRNVNKLNAAFNFKVDVVQDGVELEREFDAFVEMHQAQWRAVGKLGHFGDWPGSLEFSRDLVRAFAPAGRVRLIRLLADDRVVSYYWCFSSNGTYYWRLPARLSGEQWDQFSLGRVGLMQMIEVAAHDGATAVEAGTGRYEYKEKLNARTLPLCSLTLCRRDFGSRLRAQFALLSSDALNRVYYRLWYVRAAPRIGVLRRPLWRSWIRTRF